MHGTVIQKAARLAIDLARAPGRIGLYAAHLNSKPVSVKLPWFSWSSIEFLNSINISELDVFEYGSGGSTLFFASRARRVTSVEDNSAWYNVISREIYMSNIENAQVILADSSHESLAEYANTTYLQSLNKSHDIIVVDGSEDWPRECVRQACFERAEDNVRPGGMIIVDDAWRYDDLIAPKKARTRRIFESVGPSRLGVTRTDIYFY